LSRHSGLCCDMDSVHPAAVAFMSRTQNCHGAWAQLSGREGG
jgi:hypothetical protein